MFNITDHLRRWQPIFALVIGASLMLTSVISSLVANGVDDPERQVGSSDQYVAPDLDAQAHLDTIREDFGSGLQELRIRELEATGNFAAPLVLDPQLALQAQKLAESNAVENKEGELDRNLSAIQLHLPVESSSAQQFFQQIVSSQPHTDVLVDPEMTFYGIGVAQGHGQVWLTVVMSR